MPKGFTDDEKKIITNKLIEECKYSWQRYGYKKTSVDELCKNAGISKGAFYIFFKTKEELFYNTLKEVQENLYKVVEEKIAINPNKNGVADALKEIFSEYINSSFMYDTKSVDFISFFNKLSEEERNDLSNKSYIGAKGMLNKPFLKLKIEEDLAISVLSAMLITITQKDNMLCDPMNVFDFMINNLIDSIFE